MQSSQVQSATLEVGSMPSKQTAWKSYSKDVLMFEATMSLDMYEVWEVALRALLICE